MHTLSSLISSRRLAAALFCLCAPLAARAGTINTNSPAITAAPGSSGMFEEYITTAGNLTGDTVTAFTLTLMATTTTASGLHFTAVSMATTPDTYIFQGQSADAMNGTAFSSSTFPNLSFTVSDSDTNNAGVTLVSGANYGLVEVFYMVDANATPGTYTLTPNATLTGSGSLGVGNISGTFTILPVPEPSTWAMLAGGGLLGLVALRRRFSS